MRLNIGYIRSGNPLHDTIIKEILCNMMGFPLDIIDENERENYFICLKFEDSIPGTLKIILDGKTFAIFEKSKYLQIFKAKCGVWDDSYRDEGLIQPPKITQYIFDLSKHVRDAYKTHELPLIQKWFWPKGKSHVICVTHDIDFLVRQNLKVLSKRITSSFFNKILILRVFDRLFKSHFSETIGNNIATIINLEESLNLKSTFFIFSNLKEYKEIAPDEDITEEHYKNLTNALSNAYEVGLHGSIYSYKNMDLLKKEKSELESSFEKIEGIRQHRLNFFSPLTWEYQRTSGFKYDSSFSHNEYFGFRSGLCHPYHPVNSLEMRIIDILEIPLSFMDWTVMYRNINLQEAFSLFKELNSYCERYAGVFVVNFHNVYFDSNLYPIFSVFIQKLLRQISKTNAWKPTLGELYKWWIRRQRVQLNVTYEKKLNLELKTDMPIYNLCLDVGQKEFISLDLEREFRLTL